MQDKHPDFCRGLCKDNKRGGYQEKLDGILALGGKPSPECWRNWKRCLSPPMRGGYQP